MIFTERDAVMKVRDLIKELQQVNQDADVYLPMLGLGDFIGAENIIVGYPGDDDGTEPDKDKIAIFPDVPADFEDDEEDDEAEPVEA